MLTLVSVTTPLRTCLALASSDALAILNRNRDGRVLAWVNLVRIFLISFGLYKEEEDIPIEI